MSWKTPKTDWKHTDNVNLVSCQSNHIEGAERFFLFFKWPVAGPSRHDLGSL